MNKKTSNASKKPTSLLTLVNRTYRKVLAIEKDLVHANEEICAMRNRQTDATGNRLTALASHGA